MRPPRGTRGESRALGLVVAALAVAKVVDRGVSGAHVAVGLGLIGCLLVIARAQGLAAAELGLDRSSWPAGLRWGAAAATLVGALAGLTANTGSCILSNNAFNPVPFNGGLDLYLRWEANPPYAGFTECFANGVDEETAAVLAATQRPAAAAQLSEPSGPPAWTSIPSWALLGTQDHVIPPALQQRMYERASAHISTVKAGHLSLVTRPGDVTKVILSAIDATT